MTVLNMSHILKRKRGLFYGSSTVKAENLDGMNFSKGIYLIRTERQTT
jgi:hypothetical protein